MQLFCKEMIKVPFNRYYALEIKNEKKLPQFFKTYDNNDYENSLFSSTPQTFKYALKAPCFQSIVSAYSLKENNIEKIPSRPSGANMFMESQILFMNSVHKSNQNSETKVNQESAMYAKF